MRRSLTALLVGLGVALALAPAVQADDDVSRQLRRNVSVDGILEHARALQLIADANGGTRASGTAGYGASADYVAERLRRAGLRVTRQTFEFPFFQELAPAELELVAPAAKAYALDTDFVTMTFSGSGDVTGAIQAVDLTLPPGAAPNTSTSGCETADFAGFTPGNVALLQRGTCPFGTKAANAQAAGAAAAIIFNEGTPGAGDRQDAVAGTLGGPVVTIPVVGASFAVGQELADLAAAGPATIREETSTVSETRITENVLGDTRKGDADKTIVIGAHLDSRIEGPGINDNGSGTSMNLEIAEELRHGPTPRNRLRFAFWGAEELGLLGSGHYVDDLSANNPAELARIKANLNFDMVASPNFARFVYDGDNSAFPVGPNVAEGPDGSGLIERIFTEFLDRQGLFNEPTAFDGRSDYGPFIAEGIPAGGLFTGAEVEKTPEQAAVYGGQAGVAYDPCYHEACDTFANLNAQVLGQMSQATAHAVATLGFLRSPIADDAPVVTDRGGKGRGRGGRTYRGPNAVR